MTKPDRCKYAVDDEDYVAYPCGVADCGYCDNGPEEEKYPVMDYKDLAFLYLQTVAEKNRLEREINRLAPVCTLSVCKGCGQGYRLREMSDGVCAHCLHKNLKEAEWKIAEAVAIHRCYGYKWAKEHGQPCDLCEWAVKANSWLTTKKEK